MPRLTIWSNQPLPAAVEQALRAGTASHALTWKPGHAGADAALRDSDIAFGQPPVVDLLASERLRFVQLTSAGYTPYDRADLRATFARRGAALAKASRVFDEPCAEHALAFMLANARRLPEALDLQRADRSWLTKPLRERSRLLLGQVVVLYGYGSIGARLAQLLAPFQMTIVGIRRRVAGDEPVTTLALDDPAVNGWLGRADHVVNLLPASDQTTRAFGVAEFAAMKPGAAFYNIGRGTTVDQTALRAALTGGPLSAAYLDVTDPEPLPAGDPLWSTPGCVITPHTGGGHHDEEARLVAHFLANLARLERGEALDDRVY